MGRRAERGKGGEGLSSPKGEGGERNQTDQWEEEGGGIDKDGSSDENKKLGRELLLLHGREKEAEEGEREREREKWRWHVGSFSFVGAKEASRGEEGSLKCAMWGTFLICFFF